MEGVIYACNTIQERLRVDSLMDCGDFVIPISYDFKNVELPKEFVDGVVAYNNGKMSSERLSKLLEEIKENLIKDNSLVGWEIISIGMTPNNAFHFFAEVQNKLSDEDYWKGLRSCWSLSDNMPPRELGVMLFKNPRPGKEHFMNKEDKERFDELPEKLIIYRGCSEIESQKKVYGLSWTIDRDVAEFFAEKYIKNKDVNSTIVEVKVSKSSLFAYIGGREESEVIYF